MSSSVLSVADHLSEGLHNYKCTNSKSCVDYISTKDNQSIFKCIKCSKNHRWHFYKYLIKRFRNTNEICDKDINNFFLILKKGFIQMNAWIAGKDDKELLTDKNRF